MNLAVVGAGMSGLSCALRLQQAGHVVTVFERDPEVGGRMATVVADGLSIDVGANLLLDHYDRLKAIAAEVGLADTWFEFQAGNGGVLEDQQTADKPLSTVSGLARQQGMRWVERARLVGFLADAWRDNDGLDFFDLSAGDEAMDGVDTWTGVEERVGEGAARHLVDPFVRAFHFHGSRHLSYKYFRALAGLLVQRGRFTCHGFRGFMGSLPRAIAARLDVRTQAPVWRVARDAGGWIVQQGVDEERFDAVVVATTASVARRLIVAPSPIVAHLLDSVAYSRTATCSYRVPRDAIGDFEGLLVPFHESALIANCANEACKGSADADGCVVSLGLHDEAAAALVDLPDDALARMVALEWARLYPRCADRMTALHVHRWSEALPIYGVGSLARIRRFWEAGQGDDGLWLCGDYLNHPWLEGAVRCGEEVARRIGAAP